MKRRKVKKCARKNSRLKKNSIGELKIAFDNIRRVIPNDLMNDDLGSSLIIAANVDCCEYENFEDAIEKLRCKRCASETLKLISPRDISNEFCIKYYLEIQEILFDSFNNLTVCEAISKLDDYIIHETDLDEKFNMLQTLSLCLTESTINLLIFDKFPITEWQRELLTSALLTDYNDILNANVMISQILKKIETLDNILKARAKITIEYVLETLIKLKNDWQFDIQFINDVLYLLGSDHCLLDTIQVSKNLNEVQVIIKNMKYCKISIAVDFPNENDQTEISNILSNYTMDTIERIVMLIDKNNFSSIKYILRMLEDYDIDSTFKEECMMQLSTNHGDVGQWKNKLMFFLIKNIITDKIVEYKEYYHQDATLTDKGILKDFYVSTVNFSKKKNNSTLLKFPEDLSLLYDLNVVLSQFASNSDVTLKQTLKIVEELIENLKTKVEIIQFINAFEILNEYEYYYDDNNINEIHSLITADDIQMEFHNYVIKKTFPGTYEKSLDQIMSEFREINNSGIFMESDITDFKNVIRAYHSPISSFGDKPIKDWGKNKIFAWTTSMRTKNFTEELFRDMKDQMIAIIIRTAEIRTGLKLRDVQILTAIILLNNKNGKGRLAQVNTGEGKTIIIAVIAAYHALLGDRVDIITSSPLLAIPQSEQFHSFFKNLCLTVSHNIDNNNNSYSCYNCNVIYGTNNSFQADILREEFRKRNTRSGRSFDVVILDEVDNMLIDNNNNILRLSYPMSGMDYLETILSAIYIQIRHIANSLREDEDGRVYFLEPENSFDDDGKVKNEVLVHERLINCSKRDFIMKCTETHLRKLIRDKSIDVKVDNKYPEIKIPNHLREIICKVQLKKWIESAILSIFHYENGKQYIIKNTKIIVVDVNNTGVLKTSTTWSNGLHQFLQIKHGARIEPEDFATNYMTNIGSLKKYRKKIYGLTGTLGPDNTKQLLKQIYDVDSVIVPPFKLKQHKHLKPIIVNDENNWYIEIVKSCLRKLRNGQAALIIMKFIKETERVAEIFENSVNYDITKIKMYKTDADSNIVKNKLNSGDIVITTNIAGRGADFKLSKDVDHKGGLHVCLTFLPQNARVEVQNFGRTSRQGNCGTSQFVLYDEDKNDIDILKNIRNDKENIAIDRILKDVKIITTRNIIFEEFCRVRNGLNFRNPEIKMIEMFAVEERFGLWLQLYDDKIDSSDREEILRDFKLFTDKIVSDDIDGKLIHNPSIYTLCGNYYLKKNCLDDAINEYTRAIDLDPNFADSAYYNRGFTLIKKYGNDLKSNIHDIDKAIDDLKTARKLIQHKEWSLNLLQNASDGEVFTRHITNRLNLYNMHKNSIEVAIGSDSNAINEQIKELIAKLKSKKTTSDDKSKIKEAIKNLRKERKNIGVIGRAKLKEMELKVECLEDDYIPPDDRSSLENELKEFIMNGWDSIFNVSEVPPIDWYSVIGLLVLGFTQLIAGAALTIFTLGAGASLGISLMAEGISDIITAIRDGIINRDFSWATWAIQKAISITVSIVCAGFSAIKDVAKTACAGAKTVASLGTNVLTQTTKEGWKLVAKRVGLELSKGFAKEIGINLINYGIDKTLIPMIEEKIVEMIKDPIYQALVNNPIVEAMLELDDKNKNHHYQNLIISMGMKILNPQVNNKIKEIATDIVTRIADNKVKHFSAVRQLFTATKALARLQSFTSDFIAEINKSINEQAEKVEKEKNKLKDQANKTKSDTKDNEQVGNNIRSSEKMDHEKMNGDIDLSKCKNEEEQVILKEKNLPPRNISDQFVKLVSNNMINIIKGKIISPAINYGVNFTMEQITKCVDDSLYNETEDYRAHKRIIHNQNKGYNNGKKNNCEKQRNFEKLDGNTKKRVDGLINELDNGGPAGLPHLGAVSDAIDRPIAVYDEKGKLKYIIGDNKQGKPIEVQHFKFIDGNNNGIGHFTLKGNREPFNKNSDENMCLFNVIAEQTGCEPDELKRSALNIMNNSKETLAKQIRDIERLEINQNNNLLYGGAQYNGKCPDHAKLFIDNSNGRKGFDKDNPAHSDFHVPIKGDIMDKLNAVSDVTGKKVEVYDQDGKLKYIVGDKNLKGNPIKLQYYKPKGNESEACFTTVGGNERFTLQDPTDKTFLNVISKQTRDKDVNKLKSALNTIYNDQRISAEQIQGISRLNINQNSKLINPDHEKHSIDESNGRKNLGKDSSARLDSQVSMKSGFMNQLNAVSDVTGKKIEIYNKDGKLKYTVGNKNKKGDPIKFQYHKPKGNKSEAYFTTVGSNERYTLQDPTDMTIYNIISKQTGYKDVNKLKSDVCKKMDQKRIPRTARCIENQSRRRYKTGYLSADEQAFVTHYALQTESAKIAMAKLNKYNASTNNSEEYTRQVVEIPADELNLPREAYGGHWEKGKLQCTWPITDVVLLLQHYPGQQNNPKSRVHIQTNYPRAPPE